MQKSRSHAGVKATLVLAVMSLVSATAAVVYFPWLLTSRKNVDSVIQEVNETITRVTSREVVRNFNNVQATLDLTKNVFNNQLIALNNPQPRETFFFDLLSTQPNIAFIQFGFANGSFFGVQREKDKQGKQTLVMNVINRIWSPQEQKTDKITVPYKKIGQKFVPQPTVKIIENYNATQRPWYKEAEKNPDKIAWTDVYIFRTSKTPGISASIPLDQGGKRLGVISIDFELRQISDYLKELMEKRSEGIIFLVNENNELIASSSFNQNDTDSNSQKTTSLKLKQLGEIDNLYLNFVEQILQSYKLSIKEIADSQNTQTQYIYRDSNTNDRYYVSLSPLQYPEAFKSQNANYPKWVVGTVIPESYYVAEINENKRRLFYIVIGFLVLAGGLAIFIADRVFVQPILAIAKAAQAIEAEQFEAVNLNTVTQRQDELGHLASVFETMSRQVYSREKQLKEQLQALSIEIDQSKYQKDVQDIVESEFFQKLNNKAPLHRQQIHDTLEENSPHTKIISVHSYRGGTGKSNLTANIAVNLAQYGYRVGIIDTDLPSPGIHVLFGFQSEDIDPSLNDYLWGRCEIEEVAHDVTAQLKDRKTERSRLYLIPASVRTAEISKILREGYNVDTLREGIKSLIVSLALDYLLIDTHPGINEETLLSITLSHLLILILRPDQQDFQGTAVTVDVARKLGIPKLLSVVNKSPSSFDFEQLQEKVEKTYNLEVAAILPHSDTMMLFGSEGLFVIDHPDDLLTQKVEEITQQIINL